MLHSSCKIAFVLCALIFIGCYAPIDEVVVEGPQPIPKIVYWDSSIEIYPSVSWPNLVHTDLFQGFNPGMTFKDALGSVGQPDKTGKGLWGPYYEYWQPSGSVRVSFETIESGAIGSKFSKWRLTAFPREGSIDAILDPILRERLNRPFRNQAELVIMAPGGGHPAISVMIRDNHVHSIEWLSD